MNLSLDLLRNLILKYFFGRDEFCDQSVRCASNKTSRADLICIVKSESERNRAPGEIRPSNAFSLDDIKRETLRDPILQLVSDLTQNNTWYKLDELHKYPELRPYHETLTKYRHLSNELTVTQNKDIILR